MDWCYMFKNHGELEDHLLLHCAVVWELWALQVLVKVCLSARCQKFSALCLQSKTHLQKCALGVLFGAPFLFFIFLFL